MPSPEATLAIGQHLQEARRFADARQCYQRILRADPDHADANHLLGLLAHQQGDHALAITHVQRALVKRPACAQYLNSLGAAFRALGRHPEAQTAFESAIHAQPGFADAQNNLGAVLFAQGKFAESEACYHKAIALKPTGADAYINLGAVHHALRSYDRAEESLRTALRLTPQNPLAWNNLGNVFKAQERLPEAIDCYRQALAADPNYSAAWGNLALSLQAQGDWQAATEAFDRSLAATAGAGGVVIKRALALPVILESIEQLTQARHRFDTEVDTILASDLRIADPNREAGVCVFHLAYHGINDRDRIRRVAAMFEQVCPSLNYIAPHCRAPQPRQGTTSPLRVGFISRFFHNHSIVRHYGGLIQHLARDRFRVVLLRFPGSDDEMARSLAASADECVILAPDLSQAREQIAGQKLDLLYYTDIGMDPLTYFLAFARLAPVQCVTNGHPVTTGIPAMDYFVSCAAIEPANADDHYTERLVRMQNIPNYYERPRPEGKSRSRAACGFADDWHVYLCAQNLCKLHPDFDPILGEILRRDLRGRLILFHGGERVWSDRLVERFRRSIPDVVERVGFIDHQRNDVFLQILAQADVVLDSTHFCGGTTTAQALAMGAAVVTLPGEFMRGRITYGSYLKMGVPDCIARDADDYVRIAVRLGTDRAYRESVRSAILNHNGVLFDNPGFVRELEDFFVQAIRGAPNRDWDAPAACVLPPTAGRVADKESAA